MRLTIVVPVLGQHAMANVALKLLLENATDPNTRILVIDNGGDYQPAIGPTARVELFRPMQGLDTFEPRPKNIGVYPTFPCGMANSEDADIVAFFHSDIMVVEKGFDKRILDTFESHPTVGLIGFVGSNEIDYNGGRGGGTCSNFQGNGYNVNGVVNKEEDGVVEWQGSPAQAHGRREMGWSRAAVVDGCVMIIRRTAWNKIGYRDNFPPHHFYDRLISTQMLEAGFEVLVLGVAFDHISGQTVGGEGYNNFAREWSESKGLKPAEGASWDSVVYNEAEKQWLSEYRDQKHLIPVRV